MHETHEPDALDRALDEALRSMTDVRGIESSRARVLARLAGTPAAHGSNRWVAAFPRSRWAAAAALVVAGIVTFAVWRQGVPPDAAPGPSAQRETARSGAAPPQAAAAGDPGTASRRARLQPDREITDQGVPVQPHVNAALARRPTPSSHAAQAARRSALIRAVQSLPQEVWDRTDMAGPPAALAPLDAGEISTGALSTAPLVIHELPSDAASPQLESTGGSR